MQVKHHPAAGGFVELLHGDAVGLEGLHTGQGDCLRAARDMRVVVGGDVENIACLGDHQRVSWRARHDVEEGQDVLVLVDLVTG